MLKVSTNSLAYRQGLNRVRAELPDHLSFKDQTIKVTGQGCVPFDISALRDGQIVGTVLNVDGQPVVSVPVSLVSADARIEEILSNTNGRGAWTFSVTNHEGRFGFSHLAPGGYLLIINRAEFAVRAPQLKANVRPPNDQCNQKGDIIELKRRKTAPTPA